MEYSPGLEVVGHRLLVFLHPSERKTESGIVIPDGIAEREDMKQMRATVVQVGFEAYMDDPRPWCNVGDIVYIAKYSGQNVDGKDGKKYRILNDHDITAVETRVN